MILALIGLILLALLAYDAYRSRRCAWCGQARPTLTHYYSTHHKETP